MSPGDKRVDSRRTGRQCSVVDRESEESSSEEIASRDQKLNDEREDRVMGGKSDGSSVSRLIFHSDVRDITPRLVRQMHTRRTEHEVRMLFVKTKSERRQRKEGVLQMQRQAGEEGDQGSDACERRIYGREQQIMVLISHFGEDVGYWSLPGNSMSHPRRVLLLLTIILLIR